MEVKLKVHSCSQKNGRAGNQGVPRRGTSAFLLAPVVGAGQRTKGSNEADGTGDLRDAQKLGSGVHSVPAMQGNSELDLSCLQEG